MNLCPERGHPCPHRLTIRNSRTRLSALLLAGLMGAVAVGRVEAGTITGIVRAEGKPEADQGAADGKYDSRKFKFVERVNYAELRDFVVSIEGLVGTNVAAPKTVKVETRRITQQGAVFTPHILPVVAGTTVEWPNHDDIFHNVFSMSETKQFDLGLYKHPEVKQITFDESGRVEVFCSIHANMHCIILVLENPYFAVTDDKNRFTISNVPAGTYKLKAWHERLPSLTKEITVTESGETRVDFTLGIINLPKY